MEIPGIHPVINVFDGQNHKEDTAMKAKRIEKMFPVSVAMMPESDKATLAESIATMIGTGTFTEADIESALSSVAGADPAECKAAAAKIFKAAKAKETWATRRAGFGKVAGSVARVVVAVAAIVAAIGSVAVAYMLMSEPTKAVDATTGTMTKLEAASVPTTGGLIKADLAEATKDLVTKDDLGLAVSGLAETGEASAAVAGLATKDDIKKVGDDLTGKMLAFTAIPVPVTTALVKAEEPKAEEKNVAEAKPVEAKKEEPKVEEKKVEPAKKAVLADCIKDGIDEATAYKCCLTLDPGTQQTECRITVRSLVKISKS